MSENRESRPSVTGVLSNKNSFVQRATDVLSQNISDAEKEQMIRKMLENQVTGDDYTVPTQSNTDKVGKEPELQNSDKYKYRHKKYDNKKHKLEKELYKNVSAETIIDPFIESFQRFGIANNSIFENNLYPFGYGRGRRFIGPFDLMEPRFFRTSRLQHDVEKMFYDKDLKELEQECKLDLPEEEESKHLKFTSKLVSIGSDGIKRTRVVNGVTKMGKDGNPVTHKKMISSDNTGKTIKEVFADGTERTTKLPFIKGKDHVEDSD